MKWRAKSSWGISLLPKPDSLSSSYFRELQALQDPGVQQSCLFSSFGVSISWHRADSFQWGAGVSYCYLLSGRRAVFPTQTEGCHLTFKGLQERHATTTPQKNLLNSSRSPAGPLNVICSPAVTASHWSGQKLTGCFPSQQAHSLIISRTAKGVLDIFCGSSVAVFKCTKFQGIEKVKKQIIQEMTLK